MRTIVRFVCLLLVLLSISCKDTGTNPHGGQDSLGVAQISADLDDIVLRSDGTVWAWGPNLTGALGNGSTESSDIPKRIPKLENIIAVDQSYGVVVAADKSGDIWFWGNFWIYEGSPAVDTNVVTPVKIANVSDAAALSLTKTLLFVKRMNGTLCRIVLSEYTPTVLSGPVEVMGPGIVTSLSKYLAVTTDGKIFDLGNMCFLQESLNDVVATACGTAHFLALTKDGNVWAWGNNDFGQLGNGTFNSSSIPKQVANIGKASFISAAANLSLAVVDGKVWEWGHGGVLGDSVVERSVAWQVEPIGSAFQVSAAVLKSLVAEKDGTCWTFRNNDLAATRFQLK
jgi:alpha-tubulin suppressor-like RCC1 family protein